MQDNPKKSLQEKLTSLAVSSNGQQAPRIERVEVDGSRYWIKRAEKLGLRLRLQKGDPQKAFDHERNALHTLGKAGVPVPEICAEGADFVVMPDYGLTVNRLLREETSPQKRSNLMRMAGVALGQMHKLGYAHGRPSLKDMCVDGERIVLLDLENFNNGDRSFKLMARDIVVFAINAASMHDPKTLDLHAALSAYRNVAPPEVWPFAQKWCRKLRWVERLTRPLQKRPEGRSREFKAFPVVIDLFENG